MQKPKLKLVETPKPLPPPSNFWRTCPAALRFLPETECPKGKPQMHHDKVQDEPECPWWINSKSHNYCFWRFVKDQSAPDGSMKEFAQAELSELFGWSNTRMYFSLKQAMTELTEALKTHKAIELLKELDEDELANIFDGTDLRWTPDSDSE